MSRISYRNVTTQSTLIGHRQAQEGQERGQGYVGGDKDVAEGEGEEGERDGG